MSFPPLAPSVAWFSNFLKEYILTQDRETAIRQSNLTLSSPKEFGRFSLLDPKGEAKVQSVAVEGGSRQLRSFSKIEDLRLSEHGDWRKVHLGALEAILGRKPFFRDLEPGLKNVYLNSQLLSLKDFNFAIFEVLFSFFIGNISPATLAEFKNNPKVKARGKEIAGQFRSGMSVLQAAASFGKETLLGLLAMKE